MIKIIKYVLIDILRNKIVIGFTLFLLLLSLGVFSYEDNPAKGLLSLLNLVLIVVPLFSILFSAIYIYNSAEFLELLLSQPLKRTTIWMSLFFGLAIPLLLAFFIGTGVPVLFYSFNATGIMLVIIGLLLTAVFVSVAMLCGVMARDKAKGIGIALFIWLYFALLFDSILLYLIFQFADYPLEKPLVAASMLNPIDLGRIMILLKMDISALMGYTGAIFKNFFGTVTGIILAMSVMFLWAAIPVWLSIRKFKRKDL